MHPSSILHSLYGVLRTCIKDSCIGKEVNQGNEEEGEQLRLHYLKSQPYLCRERLTVNSRQPVKEAILKPIKHPRTPTDAR